MNRKKKQNNLFLCILTFKTVYFNIDGETRRDAFFVKFEIFRGSSISYNFSNEFA